MFRQNSLLLHVVLLNMNAENVREKSVCHNMQRRMVTHNYALPGIYHITLHVAEEMGLPLGQVEGSLEQPDNTPGTACHADTNRKDGARRTGYQHYRTLSDGRH
jgi:hypothetical protein